MQLSLLFLPLLSLVATASCTVIKPPMPQLTHLYTANVTVSQGMLIGNTPSGTRTIVPIAGGSFEGLIKGKFLPIGADSLLTWPNGKVSPDVMAVLQTDDGSNIVLKQRGYLSKDRNVYYTASFETGSEKYDWLNYVVATCFAKQPVPGASRIKLEMYIVSFFVLEQIDYYC